MGLFRREPLHRKLARQGGLERSSLPEARPPGWMETGIHGVPRQRQWDAVVTVEAAGVEGDEARFVVLPNGDLLVEEGDDVAPLADALEGVAEPPFRVEAVRRGPEQWAAGIRRIEVVQLDHDPGGDELTLTVRDGEREVLVDGARSFGSIPELERLGAAHADAYAVAATRLDGALWEVRVVPL